MAQLDRKRVDLALDRDLHNQLIDSAAIDGRSVNAQINWLLTSALEQWRVHNEQRYLKDRSLRRDRATKRTGHAAPP